jgi:acyl-CoA dehydrogenase
MTSADGVDPLLVQTLERILGATATFEAVERAEPARWCEPVWSSLAGAGIPWIPVPEAAGGSGGSTADALAVLHAIGRHAAPVPVAETGLLGGWLWAQAGGEVPSAPLTVVPHGHLEMTDGRLQGEAVVAWAERSDRILSVVEAPAGWQIVSVRPSQVEIVAGANLAGEPRDRVRFDLPVAEAEVAPAPPGLDGLTLHRRGALSRVALSAGALERLAEMTIEYTHDRQQFGRPVAAFQAVQAHLVAVAQAAVRATMASAVAGRAVAQGGGAFEVAAAKAVVDDAVVEGTRAAHQAHGAMGVTREYPLHHLTRRLWAWRHEHGGGRQWRAALGTEVVAGGADGLFPAIAR